MNNTKTKKLLLSLLLTMGLVSCGGTTETETSSLPMESTPVASTPEKSTPVESTPIESSSSDTGATVGDNQTLKKVMSFINGLSAIENTTAFDYIPETMLPLYSKNLVNEKDIAYDFESFTNVSSINKAGYGEQWQMVLDNIYQSAKIAKIFNVVQSSISVAGKTIEDYLSKTSSSTIDYNFEKDNFTGKLQYNSGIIAINIDFTKSINYSLTGEIKPKLFMGYDMNSGKKSITVNLGDAYKLKYMISGESYAMATTYGVNIGETRFSRSSYLSISKKDNKTVGHIYEYTSKGDKDMIKACADFYMSDGFVSVVGNKASGMLGFKGYINELYLESEGRLLGYEVEEEVSSIAYNTLWFNLWDISGINNVKVTEKSKENNSSKSTVDVYLNNSSSLLSPTYNSKLGIKTSRKYDVELRSRFYYTYDAENEVYVSHEIQVPMMMIQEGDNFNSFSNDMQQDNGLTTSVALKSEYLNKILSDYDTLIPIFKQNKDSMSSEEIQTLLNK